MPWVGATAVRLTTTALAPEGTPANPVTEMVFVVAGVRVELSHWLAGPVRPEGFPALVSQIRTGAGSALNFDPVPPAEPSSSR